MNSSQLLNSLNKQSHNKHNKAKNKSVLMETINQKPEQTIQSKENQFTDIKILPSQLPTPPDFLVEMLKQQKKSKMFRNKKLTQEVTKMCKQRQKNVFLAYNDSHLAYLSELKDLTKNKSEHASNCISDVMMRRYNMVTGDLENGKLFINHDRSIVSKEQLEKLQEIDRARLLKIKQGAIRSKLDLLHVKMEEMELINTSPKNNQSIQAINKKIQENLDQASYGLQSQKTKIARDYVKYMAQQRKQRRKRQQLREQRKQKIQQQRQIQLKQAEQMKDLSKKQQTLQKIQEKRKKRQEEQRIIGQKEQKIEEFLQKYRHQMPIYKKKQKQFEQKYVKPQKAYRQQRLKQIKQKKKSYSLNDIVDHEKKYQQIKKKQLQRKLNEKQLQIKSLKINTKQYYKGSAHKFVQQADKRNREKDIYLYELGKNRYERMVGYAKQIKEDFKPKVDQNKRSELLKLLEFQQMKKGGFQKKYKPIYNENGEDIGVQSFYEEIPKKDRYQQGNKFMEQGNLRRRKNISQSVDVSSSQNQKQEQKQESLKLLQNKSSIKWGKGQQNEKQIWKLRSKQMSQMSNNLSSPKQFEQVKINFENLDKKAADKQILMKHAKMSVQQFIQQKGALDNFYLQSIKNKMKLLQ